MNCSVKFKPLSLILFVCLTFSALSCHKTKGKYIGLQLYSVRDTIMKDVPGTISAIGKMGYKYVEAANYKDGKFYGMEPLAFKALCNKNGLAFLGSHVQLPAPDSVHWEEAMKWWDKCITAHKNAGVKYIIQPYMSESAYKDLNSLRLYCKYFNAVGEKCNAKGIRFGFHNHDREFQKIDSVTIYDFLLQHTDSTKVAMEMDLYWVIKGGANPLVYFQKYPGRFLWYHVKDEKELSAMGKIDFRPYFVNAKQAGLKYCIVEVEHYNFTPLISVKKSFDFINHADYVK